MKKQVGPSPLIIEQKIGDAVPEQFIALILQPGFWWILIVLPERHSLARKRRLHWWL
jgi:hypothetical protein